MKTILLLLVMLSTIAIAEDGEGNKSQKSIIGNRDQKPVLELNPSTEQQEVLYAKIYSDYLIKEFDSLLDQKIELNDRSSILNSSIYFKLLSARDYIESRLHYDEDNIQATLEKKYKYLFVEDQKLYNQVIKEINQNAEEINEQQLDDKKILGKVEPSASRSGNFTGVLYPTNLWSLTYDDGPSKKTTTKIVDMLYQNNIKSTFFMLTRNAKTFLETAQYVKESGMEVALHSYTHKSLRNANDKVLTYEISKAKKDLENLLDVSIKLFRLPYGAGLNVKNVRQKIAQNNLIHIFWDVDTLDWKESDPKKVFARTLKQMKLAHNQSGVILFHDIKPQTVEVTKLLIEHFKKNGLNTCSVQEMINFQNGLENECFPVNK